MLLEVKNFNSEIFYSQNAMYTLVWHRANTAELQHF